MQITQAIILALAGFTIAHPGHEESEHELMQKRQFNANTRRGFSKCADVLEKRGVTARAEARRRAAVEKYRKTTLRVRDTDTVLNKTHLSNKHYDLWTPDDVVFNKSSTCVLNPEGEVGPFWVPGELINQDLRESQPGVPVVLEAQFLDVETCEPLTELWWDLWNCNSTGVYSGVVESGNGNGADLSNINATFLRGIQKADSDGVVTFQSIFPGHYSGRTNHHHMIAYLNATVLPNNTLTGATYAHVAQTFWDQRIIDKVEATYPYSTNNITQTTNAEDRVFKDETEDTTTDPVFKYVHLGPSLEDGLFGWLTVVVNTSASESASYSFIYTEDGGEADSSGGGTPGGTTGGNGTAPSGSGSATGAVPTASLAKRSFEAEWR